MFSPNAKQFLADLMPRIQVGHNPHTQQQIATLTEAIACGFALVASSVDHASDQLNAKLEQLLAAVGSSASPKSCNPAPAPE